MRTLSESEVKEIVEGHELWLKTDWRKGKRATFDNVDLSGMDFHGRNLQNVCFAYSDLQNANFRNARLCNADLLGANLANADLRGADLTGANLDDTDMDGAIYDETTLPTVVCPKEGSFIGFKKAYDVQCFYDAYIVELWIPKDAKRSSATGKKCRCSKAEVLSITNLDGTETDATAVRSWYSSDFVYRLGETVEVPDFDECRWHECTKGIHFFMDRKDAVKW